MRRFAVLVALVALGMSPLAVTAAFAAKGAKSEKKEGDSKETSKLVAGTFAGLSLRSIGPALMSGRIADIAIDPRDQSTWFVAVGSGGVWKTENAGNTWKPIFDGEASYSIGCVSLDPSDPNPVRTSAVGTWATATASTAASTVGPAGRIWA